MNISNVLDDYLLLETIEKCKGGFKVRLETGELLPKIYKNKRTAAARILGLKSRGGFYNKPKREQEKMITNYLRRH